MKKRIVSLAVVGLLSGFVYAGGKGVEPALSPVVEIPAAIDPSPFYLGIGALWAGMSRECACADGKVEEETYGGILRAGYEFNQYVGLEARGLYSNIEKDIATTKHYGLFLKPMVPAGEHVNLYGLIGYGKTQIDCITSSLSYDKNGVSWGAGIEYDFSDKDSDREYGLYDREFDGQADQEKGWGIWIDYQNLLHDSGISHFNSNIVTAGFTYDF
ncbi:MAG: outer membrane beta-barrel protein [Sulfurovum sp.]